MFSKEMYLLYFYKRVPDLQSDTPLQIHNTNITLILCMQGDVMQWNCQIYI